METFFQLLNFTFGVFLIAFGFKSFKSSEETYLKAKKKISNYL